MKCAKCGQDNTDDSRYCKQCGLSVSAHVEKGYDLPTTEIKKEYFYLSPGQDFGQRYTIIGEIGRGGMGYVYKALDKELNQVVALKIIRPDLSSEPTIVERFKRELILAREISHENVIRIHDIGEESGIKYLSMSYIEGINLKKHIVEAGKFDADRAAKIINQIAKALLAAHKKGVIHRDLKPSNVMIDAKGTIYVMDFGLAKSVEVSDLTRDGVILGTPEYMSPEQIQGKSADQRSDIYSLGIIFYEMMTGTLPFRADSLMGIAHQHIYEKPSSPSKKNPLIPGQMEQIILKCMEKNPNDRYQDSAQLIDELKASKPSAPMIKILSAKNWKLSASILVLIFIILAGMTYFLLNKQSSSATKSAPHKVQAEASINSVASLAQWRNSIAVLPFKNLSSDPQQEYFCDGMTEQIITNLTRIHDLKVIARTSVMQYKNTTKDIRQIGKELGVANILEGSVQKADSQIRVIAQLIKTEDGFHLWAKNYDEELKNVFAIQDEVSQAIADELQVSFSSRKLESSAITKPQNIAAYENYLKSRYLAYYQYLETHNEKDFEKALHYAKKAVEIDPSYAVAYASFVSLYEVHYLFTSNSKDLDYMKLYAEKAYELNPDIPETLLAKGWAHTRLKEHDKAFYYFKKALEISPNNTDTNDWLGDFSANVGLYYQAIRFHTRALELNPLHVSAYIYRGTGYMEIGELQNALNDFQKILEIQPNNLWGIYGTALCYIVQKDFGKAKDFLDRAEKTNAEDEGTRFLKALYLAYTGKKQEALSLSRSVRILSSLNMRDEAISLIQTEIEKDPSSYNYLSLTRDPLYAPLNPDPRFQAIVAFTKKIYEQNQLKYSIK